MVGHPWEAPVPGASEWTTANPRGTHVPTNEFEMRVITSYSIHYTKLYEAIPVQPPEVGAPVHPVSVARAPVELCRAPEVL